MSNQVIQMKAIRKRYNYSDEVLRGIDFSVDKGSIMGLVGKNGAGKTTLLKVLLGLLQPSNGESQIFGESSWNLSAQARHRIGYVPQEMVGYRWMQAKQLLNYTGAFYSRWNRAKVDKLMKDSDVNPGQKLKDMSVGQRQKLSVILAVGHDPDILILDEPVASLDPLARRQFIKELIERNLDENKTVLFSTHITSDLERVAADIALLRNGTVNYIGDLSSLKDRIRRLRISADKDLPKNLRIKNQVTGWVENNTAVITVDNLAPEEIPKIEKELSAKISVESLNLEDIFVELNQ